MPTRKFQVDTPAEAELPNMPQSVTISIIPSPQAGHTSSARKGKGQPSNKNGTAMVQPPSQHPRSHPQGALGGPTASAAAASRAAMPPPKLPHKSGLPGSHTAAGSRAVNNYHQWLGSNSRVGNHTTAGPTATGAKHPQKRNNGALNNYQQLVRRHNDMAAIKRTKKLAKPRTKSGARKLPTKRNRGRESGKSETIIPSQFPTQGGNVSKRREGSGYKLPTKSKQAQPAGAYESSRERVKANIPSVIDLLGNSTESTPNELNQFKSHHNLKPAPKQVLCSDSHIEKLVSSVVDALAHEINYCASALCSKRPITVIDGRYDEMNQHVQSVKSGSSFSSTSSRKTPRSDTTAFTTQGESVKITANDTIVPVEKNDHSVDPRQEYAKPKDVETQKIQTQEPGSDELYDAKPVLAAVRRFALEAYSPFLASAKQCSGKGSPNPHRIQISTLLAIREMLIMNADKLFTFPALKHAPAKARERKYLSHVLANAIVRNSARRMHHPDSPFFGRFMQAYKSYDTCSEEFQFSLSQADVRSNYFHPDGKRVGQEESVLAKVSFNYAREMHPLLSKNNNSLKCPAPTACAKFMVLIK